MTDVFFSVTRFWRALVMAVVVFAPALAAAQTTTGSRVLVMPFAVNVEAGAPGAAGAAIWLGEAASVLVSEGLSTRGVGAMSRDERVLAFSRLSLPMTSALTRATTIRIGDLIGASEVIFGEVQLGTRLDVRARLVHLVTGAEGPVVVDSGELADIFQIFARVSERLASSTGRLRPGHAALAPLALETFESYVKGLVASTPTAQQRFLEAAVRAAPADPRILMALWDVYSAQGDHERALASANAVSTDAAVYPQARLAVALSLVELKRFDGAWDTLDALYDAGQAPAVSSLLGVVQLRREGATPAVHFARAVNAEPENTDYLFNLGYAYARAGNAAEALTWLRETVRYDIADGDAHYVMSALLAAAGRATESQRELELARLLSGAERDPSSLPATRVVPAGLERLPDVSDLSATAVRRTAIGNPAQRDQQETAQFHLTNARRLIENGRDREAIGELRRAVYLAPYEQVPHLLLGEVYRRGGRLSEAIEQFTVSLWCRETVAARVALGSALIEDDRPDDARRELQRALQLEPGSTEARALLARLGN